MTFVFWGECRDKSFLVVVAPRQQPLVQKHFILSLGAVALGVGLRRIFEPKFHSLKNRHVGTVRHFRNLISVPWSVPTTTKLPGVCELRSNSWLENDG